MSLIFDRVHVPALFYPLSPANFSINVICNAKTLLWTSTKFFFYQFSYSSNSQTIFVNQNWFYATPQSFFNNNVSFSQLQYWSKILHQFSIRLVFLSWSANLNCNTFLWYILEVRNITKLIRHHEDTNLCIKLIANLLLQPNVNSPVHNIH